MIDLRVVVEQTPAEGLPELIGQLVAAEERARLRLRALPVATVPRPEATAEGDRLLTPEQAATIAAVSVARVYAWARGARWASRPSRRCLRIAEHGFRRWLETRA